MSDSSVSEARKIVIKKLVLHARKRTLKPSLYESFKERWKHDPYRYFFNRYDTRIQILPPGGRTFFINDITSGFSVSKIFVFLQKQSRFEGSQSKSPFKFERFFKSSLNDSMSALEGYNFEMGGRRIESSIHHNMDHMTYLRICDMLNYTSELNIFGLTYKEFMNQCYFIGIDLAVSTCNDQFLSPLVRTGRARLELNFNNNLGEAVVAFVILEISTSAYVDNMGRVTIKNLV